MESGVRAECRHAVEGKAKDDWERLNELVHDWKSSQHRSERQVVELIVVLQVHGQTDPV